MTNVKGVPCVMFSMYKTAIFSCVKSLGSEVVSDDGEVSRIGFWMSTVWQKVRSAFATITYCTLLYVYFTRSVPRVCHVFVRIHFMYTRLPKDARTRAVVECWTCLKEHRQEYAIFAGRNGIFIFTNFYITYLVLYPVVYSIFMF